MESEPGSKLYISGLGCAVEVFCEFPTFAVVFLCPVDARVLTNAYGFFATVVRYSVPVSEFSCEGLGAMVVGCCASKEQTC